MGSNEENMDLEVLKTHEYDAQFFGFTVEDFMTAVKMLVKDEVTKYVQTLTTTLLQKYPGDSPDVEEVKRATDKLIDLHLTNSLGPLKNFEDQLKDLFHIPEHVLLPGDEAQQTQYSAEDEQEFNQRWTDLMNRIKRSKTLNMELRQELKTLGQIIPVLTQRLRELEQAQNKCMSQETIIPQLERVINEEFNKNMQLLSLIKKS